MTPGISLLRKSLRSNVNQDRDSDYESKPSTNASTVSSLTCSVFPKRVVDESPCEIDIFKRRVSQDRTLDTEVESVYLKSSLGSSSGSVLPVRRLSSTESGHGHSYRNETSMNSISKQDEESGIDTSVSSLTLDSDIKLYHKINHKINHKIKAKSFHEIRSVPSVRRSRSMTRRKTSVSTAGSHSLERIREESNRFINATSGSSCSQFTEREPVSLTLTELESVSSGPKERPSNRFGRMEETSPFTRFHSHDGSSGLNISARSDQDQSSHKKKRLQRLLSQGDQSTSSTDSYVSTKTLELISSLHEANIENESIISRLEYELSELANERDAVRASSDRIMQAMTVQQTELQAQLKRERKGFANASAVHKKELNDWIEKASQLSSKVLELERIAKLRELNDEARAEKITNLETNIAKLYDMYSSCEENNVNDSDKDIVEVEKNPNAVDSEVQDWKHKYTQLERSHDELVERNKMQCDDHQSEIRLLKTSIEKLEEENKLIRTSISAASSGSTCNDDLLDKICDLVDQNTSLVERCQEFEVLKEENCELQESLKEATNCAETAKKSIEDLKSENAALEEELELERNACEYLRQESCSSDCLEELREANDRLTAELKEKNDAMHLIKGAMDSLKADQQSIKETVVRLRMENLKLQDEKEEVVKAKAIRPPPPLNSDLESRLEQIERDNKGLREANNDLSTKLTDEIGRTKSLEQANKGLADRICTLVEFIKEIKDYRSS